MINLHNSIGFSPCSRTRGCGAPLGTACGGGPPASCALRHVRQHPLPPQPLPMWRPCSGADGCSATACTHHSHAQGRMCVQYSCHQQHAQAELALCFAVSSGTQNHMHDDLSLSPPRGAYLSLRGARSGCGRLGLGRGGGGGPSLERSCSGAAQQCINFRHGIPCRVHKLAW